jgi:hypothetical protein
MEACAFGMGLMRGFFIKNYEKYYCSKKCLKSLFLPDLLGTPGEWAMA